MLTTGIEVDSRFARDASGCRSVTRIRRAHGHPRFQNCHLLGGQAFLRWHTQILIGIANRLDERTFLRTSRPNDRTGLTAFLNTSPGVEPQCALQFSRVGRLLTVAFVAMADQKRPNLGFKKLDLADV